MNDNYNEEEKEGINSFEEGLENKEEDIKPVKLSKKVTGAILIGLILVLIMVLLMFRGCSVTKDEGSTGNNSEVTIGGTSSIEKSASKGGDTSTKVAQNTSESSSVSSSSQESSNSTKTSEKESEGKYIEGNEAKSNVSEGSAEANSKISEGNNSSSSPLLKEVNEPVLNNQVKTLGLVSDKSVYMVDNSYLYKVSILILTGNGSNTSCGYYCPKKTWDAIDSGDTVSVVYQQDSLGNISIVSISR